MANRIKKYNPAFLSAEELVRSFVVRHAELDLIMQVIRENVTQSNQHIIVIGPRGIGKTMLVLRVVEEIREEEDLRGRWYPLVFGEESYHVSTPGEFWLEALFHLAHKTGDEQWGRTFEELRDESDEERLQERALAQLMDFADAVSKRILLVVENFNMLLGDQITESDAWKLRHTLLNEPRVMLLATATSRFKEIDNADKAMFELFKLYELKALDERECGTLCASIAEKAATEERVRPLQILTGGNPRLIAIVSTFAARMSLKELMDDLMQLVDDNTEYFKSHLDSLPAIERKVYLALAELWDPATARKVADFARLNVNKASSLLRRLMKRGMVVEADGERRAKLYQVAERMYNIYYLMRRRGAPSRRVKAVVGFMVNFYGPEELVGITGGIIKEACNLKPELRKEHLSAYEAIMGNISVPSLRWELIKVAGYGFFEMPDIPDSIKLVASGEVLGMLKRANDLEEKEQLDEAEGIYLEVTDIEPQNVRAWLGLGVVLEKLSRFEEAEKVYRKIIELFPERDWGWGLLGFLFHEHLQRYEEAENAYRKALELDPKDVFLKSQLSRLLYQHFGRYEEAEKLCREAIELKEDYVPAWMYLGSILHWHFGRYEEAEEVYRKVIKLAPEISFGWGSLADLLKEHTERYEEAERLYHKALELEPDNSRGWIRLGELLEINLNRFDEVERAYRKAIELDEKNYSAWIHLGLLLSGPKLDNPDEAEKVCQKAIEIDKEATSAWALLGTLLHINLNRYEEAEKAYRKVIKLDPDAGLVYAMLGLLLHEDLNRYEEAEKAYRKSIELVPNLDLAWCGLIRLLYKELERSEEAMDLLRKYSEDVEMVKEDLDDSIEMLIEFAADGYEKEVLEIVRDSASAEILEPLVVGLQLYIGEDVKVAAEIMEVGKDVVKRIEEKRDKMQTKGNPRKRLRKKESKPQ